TMDDTNEDPVYELTLAMGYHQTTATLHLGPRRDGWPVDGQEMENLKSIVRFAGMSLEHARLTGQQVQEARLDSLVRITTQLHSHDLKNRLHDLSFLAHHMKSGKLDEEETRRMVTAIRKVVSRMQAVMQRMADPNAPIKPRLKAHKINSLVQTIVDNHLWPEGVQVHCQYDCSGMAMVDADMLESVINNLFDNAISAMDKQGVLHVSTSSCDHAIAISVCDHGCGIDATFLKYHLFQLFSTNKESGLGVGLYLSERMIAAHHGQLRAESAGKGKGSTFIIRLPLWQDVGET
ncbi:MAG: HAMP domain-containing sensor histidine kinase, partial [Mariprofundaceae bacterium]|nr:HAMP domain-containing sensor histidine kinase [Mariprofundaceae bacterium]